MLAGRLLHESCAFETEGGKQKSSVRWPPVNLTSQKGVSLIYINSQRTAGKWTSFKEKKEEENDSKSDTSEGTRRLPETQPGASLH